MHLFSWLQNLRPIEAATFEEFSTYVHDLKVVEVTGRSVKKLYHTHRTYNPGSRYVYSGFFEAISQSGRKIVFSEEYHAPITIYDGQVSSAELHSRGLQSLYTVHRRLKALEKDHQALITVLMGPTGRYDDQRIRSLEEQARLLSIESLAS